MCEYQYYNLGPLRHENQFRVALSLANVGTFGNLKPRESNILVIIMSYPIHRPRRLRRTEALRGFVRETRLSVRSLITLFLYAPARTLSRRKVGYSPRNPYMLRP